MTIPPRRPLALAALMLALPACEYGALDIEGGHTIEFGDVRSGDMKVDYLQILNTGSGGVTITELVPLTGSPIWMPGMDPSHSAPFVIWFEGRLIPPGLATSYRVTYTAPNVRKPPDGHVYQPREDAATLEVLGLDIKDDVVTTEVSLTARVVAEDCGPPPQVDFGDVSVGTRTSRTITLSNNMAFVSHSFVGSAESSTGGHVGFALDQSTPPGTTTEDPGETRTVIVWFEPSSAGDFAATLPVRPRSGCFQWDVPLSGRGL